MIQLCGDPLIHPLKLIFEAAIRSGCFPDTWKKGNVIPVHKKESKNLGLLKTIDQFHFYQYLVKYLKKYSITIFSNVLMKMIFCLINNLAFVKVIHAFRN